MLGCLCHRLLYTSNLYFGLCSSTVYYCLGTCRRWNNRRYPSSVTQAYVADITSKEEKGYVFGYLGGIVGIGLIIGPGVGGFLSSGPMGYLGTVLCALAISAITLLSIFFGLEESLPEEKRAPFEEQPISQSFRLLNRIKRLDPPAIIKKVFAIRGCFTVTMATYISTIALFMIDVFELTKKNSVFLCSLLVFCVF